VVSFYWTVQHDLRHHRDILKASLGSEEYNRFVSVLDDVARCLVPQEFGIDVYEKINVARSVAQKILIKLMTDFAASTQEPRAHDYRRDGSLEDVPSDFTPVSFHGLADSGSFAIDGEMLKGDLDEGRYELDVDRMEENLSHFRHVRTRLYFTRKSQLLALLQLLLLLPLSEVLKEKVQNMEHSLAYLASITFLVLEKEKRKLYVMIVVSRNGSEEETLGELPIKAFNEWFCFLR